jgi:hypothetical protein
MSAFTLRTKSRSTIPSACVPVTVGAKSVNATTGTASRTSTEVHRFNMVGIITVSLSKVRLAIELLLKLLNLLILAILSELSIIHRDISRFG